MRTKYSFYATAAVACSLLMQLFSQSVNYASPPSSRRDGVTNVVVASTTNSETNALASSSAGTNIFLKTIVDTNSGQYAFVDSSKEVVIMMDSSDHVIWSTNVTASIGPTRSNIMMGQQIITSMMMVNDKLLIHFARAEATIDLSSGAVIWLGGN